jgi:hypothetical protein
LIRISRPIGDALASLGALTVLLAVLVSVDPRVRDQVSLRMNGEVARSELRAASAQLRGLGSVVFEVARDQSLEHAGMMALVLTGSVLVLFMLRT